MLIVTYFTKMVCHKFCSNFAAFFKAFTYSNLCIQAFLN